MKKIYLSKGLFCTVDDSDFEFLNQYKWTASGKAKYGFRAIRGFSFFKNGTETSRPILMHRVITMCPNGFEVDHIDGDQLNNQKNNLRIVSHCSNMKNRRQKSDMTSRFKGVSFCKQSGKWVGRLQANGRILLNAGFDSEEDAAREYNKYAKQYHGKFAVLNKV